MTHEERVAIARDVGQKILQTYGDAVLAVFITSSTAKGLDREHSDLELTAVGRDGVEIEGKSYVFQGILIEIDYDRESSLLKAARRTTGRWAQEADGFRSRIVLYERDGWTARLDEAVRESAAKPFGMRPRHRGGTGRRRRDPDRRPPPNGDEPRCARGLGHVDRLIPEWHRHLQDRRGLPCPSRRQAYNE